MSKSKLHALLAKPLPDTGHQLVTLQFEDGSSLEMRKALVAVVSPVLSEAIDVDPDCTQLKVQGTDGIWDLLLGMYFCSTGVNPTPGEVMETLPIAHMYQMEHALQGLEACVRGYEFSATTSSPLYVLKWLALVRQCQVPWLVERCADFISSQVADLIVYQHAPSKLRNFDERSTSSLMEEFRPENVHLVDAPPDIIARFGAVYASLHKQMGLHGKWHSRRHAEPDSESLYGFNLF